MKWVLWFILLVTEAWYPHWLTKARVRLYHQWSHGLRLAGVGQGVPSWLLGALLPTLTVGVVQIGLSHLALGWLINFLLLALLLDVHSAVTTFRQGLNRLSIDPEDHPQRLLLLARLWARVLASGFSASFWFFMLPGAMGLVLVRTTHWLADEDSPHKYLTRLREVIDWIPAHLLALTLAMVGNFEEALLAWRSQSGQTQSMVAAVALGALGVSANHDLEDTTDSARHNELGLGAEALLGRALFIWGLAAALLTAIRP